MWVMQLVIDKLKLNKYLIFLLNGKKKLKA